MKRCVYKLHPLCFVSDTLAIFSIRLKNATGLPCTSAYMFHSFRRQQTSMRAYFRKLSMIFSNRYAFSEVALNYCLVENNFRVYIKTKL
jgi:hypothetical protein